MSLAPTSSAGTAAEAAVDYDVIVVGAGFSGLYLLHLLRERKFSVRVLEMGDGIGGTWYWNRYPGARCDVQSIEYSYSFSKEIEQEWEWTELMPAQPEIERYLNFVADRLDLRRDIQLSTKVTEVAYDETQSSWTVRAADGQRWTARFVITATGCLTVPLEPAIRGLDTFAGVKLYTSRYPKDGFDYRGKRVGVIGTGSSAVQSMPIVASQAASLHVFQRSAAYTRPANNRPLMPGELDEVKADYGDLRERQRRAFGGVLRFGAVAFDAPPPTRRILETPEEERIGVLNELGWGAPMAWADVLENLEANRAAAALYAELIRRIVKDPQTAEDLVPHYPLGCKRQILDTGYFEMFNQDHVTLVNLRRDPIVEVVPGGIRTEQHFYELDVILLATGFDAMTGALNAMDIRGRGGRLLRDLWASEGPVSYLGVQVAGFPNLFIVTGPGSPSVLSNMVVSIEQQVEWISDTIIYLRDQGLRWIEADVRSQAEWVEHASSLADGTIRTADSCSSWYLGSNVPGKRRIFMPYLGGLPSYRAKCAEVAANGYEGFVLGR